MTLSKTLRAAFTAPSLPSAATLAAPCATLMRRPVQTLAVAGALLVGVSLAAPASAEPPVTLGDLTIEQPVARAMLPGAKVGGGYVTIVNCGQTADRLVSAASPLAGSVQIHSMTMDGGVMQMREMKEGLEIPAGGTLALKPGSYHLMFVNPKAPFKQGDHVKASLTFEKAGTAEVEFLVGPAAGALPGADGKTMDHKSMDHGSMDHGAMNHGTMDHGAMNHQENGQ
ncbi:copper chaperone PCu(A)C [Rhizobium rhizosphaerae]|nr:copper chaperone PCu(A)C [Xaviernesmea rhizosphaerae]